MKLTDREIAWCNRDPIVALIIARLRDDYSMRFYGDLLASDSVALQVIARNHTLAALDAEEEGHYGSVKYHEERSAELKLHWESIERARDGERKRIRATLENEGYRQINGKIQI